MKKNVHYYNISREELGLNSKIPIVKLNETGEVFYQIAVEMIDAIKDCKKNDKECIMIVPVGPIGQYEIFVRLVNEQNISLRHVTFINMDEYLTEDNAWIDINSQLSFRGFMERHVYSRIKEELNILEENRIFPNPDDLTRIPELIKEKGVDLCVGGLGITGHVAFNEAENVPVEEFLTRKTRCLKIATETWTTNAIGDLNGALEAMPSNAITIGFNEIFSAKKIRLYVFRPWHRAVVRRAAYGEVTANFPASILQNHPNTTITCNFIASQKAY